MHSALRHLPSWAALQVPSHRAIWIDMQLQAALRAVRPRTSNRDNPLCRWMTMQQIETSTRSRARSRTAAQGHSNHADVG